MQIVDIVDAPHLIPTLLEWSRREWPPRSPGETLEARRKRLVGDLKRGQLPLCLVAVENKLPIGFVSVIHYILGGQEHWQHWLDGIYVLPEQRKKGLGATLVREAERQARGVGVENIYVFTSLGSWYHRQGWRHTDQTSAEFAVLQKNLT